MNQNSHRQTAQIYQFPIGGRSGLAIRGEASKPVADPNLEPASKIVIGGSWYHEEAIREADLSRKH